LDINEHGIVYNRFFFFFSKNALGDIRVLPYISWLRSCTVMLVIEQRVWKWLQHQRSPTSRWNSSTSLRWLLLQPPPKPISSAAQVLSLPPVICIYESMNLNWPR